MQVIAKNQKHVDGGRLVRKRTRQRKSHGTETAQTQRNKPHRLQVETAPNHNRMASLYTLPTKAVCFVLIADTPLASRVATQLPDGMATLQSILADRCPLGRLATPEEIAEAAVWACTKTTFMTGHTLVLDGGWSCI